MEGEGEKFVGQRERQEAGEDQEEKMKAIN